MRLRTCFIALLCLGLASAADAQDKKGKDKDDKDRGVTVRDHTKEKPRGDDRFHGESRKTLEVSGFAPNHGPIDTQVTITGSRIKPRTQVIVGGRPVKAEVVTDTTIVFRMPRNFVDGVITLRAPGAANDVMVGTFRAVADPEIRGFTPTSGPSGTRVELTGAGFMKGDQVMMNGKPIAVQDVSERRLVVTIPPAATSDFIVVSRPGGAQSRTKKAFTVTMPAPLISGFVPTSGPPGTVVRISVANVASDDRFFFGRFPVAPANKGDGWVEIAVPPNAKVNENFSVRGPRGIAQTASPFVIILNPTIASFKPPWGAPGNKVEIFGANFRPGDAVMLGGKPLQITQLDEKRVQVTIGPGSKSDVFKIVRGGQEVASARTAFEVTVAPAIAGFAPPAGPAGTKVTISGAAFTADAQVLYGATPLRIVGRQSDNSVDVIVPAKASDQRFTVRTRGGEAVSLRPFQVQTYSEITSVDPRSGTAGSRVWIRGKNFNPSDAFFLGGSSLAIVERAPEGYLVQIPSGAQSGVIEWETHGKRQVSRFRFEVLQPPTLAEFKPSAGPPGQQITIVGANFTRLTTAFYGNRPMQIVSRNLPSQIVAVIPPDARGTELIWVEDARQRLKFDKPFEVISPPVIAAISPSSGTPGTEVTLTGQNFSQTSLVFYGTKQLPVLRRSPSTLAVVIPTDLDQPDYFWVEDRGQKVRSGEQFRIKLAPTLASVSPPSLNAGAMLVIKGANFSDTTQVTIGNSACDVIRRGPNDIICKVPMTVKGKVYVHLIDGAIKLRHEEQVEVK